MVVVRESPHAHTSPDRNPAEWPPRSPFQALLSSPGGRKRWQDQQGRCQVRDVSPSPSKHSVRSSYVAEKLVNQDDDNEGAEADEDDEETLQLQLRALEARLKLKRLQNAKKASTGTAGGSLDTQPSREAPLARLNRLSISPTRPQKAVVDVPVSPVRSERLPQQQPSPARQRLGLTSIPKAQDVSLKRGRDVGELKRARSQGSLRSIEQSQRQSFSERLSQSKHAEDARQAKKDRLEQVRSRGFNRQQSNSPSRSIPSSHASRFGDEKQRREPSSGQVASQKSQRETGWAASTSAFGSRDDTEVVAKSLPKAVNVGAYGQDSGTGHAEDDSDLSMNFAHGDVDSSYDPFSKIHLKKRQISHAVVAREMEGKEIYTLPRLLKEIKAPDFEPPDCEADYVVFAVLASKSNPLDQAQSHKTANQARDDYEAPRNKFMVFHLCDLKWEIDCFLFGTAFNQFWKLTPGTLLAILNPAILPPKGNQNTGRFSLKLGSSEDAVMEIGLARDLGYCSAIKKDGQPCGDWVDTRKTEACEFHIQLQIEKSRKGRMEVNTMVRGFDKAERVNSRSARHDRGKGSSGGKYHREYGQLYSVDTGMGRSTASLLDAEDTDALHNMTQEEASRKRIANAQKERDLAKKLGEMGKGVGAEYMRAQQLHTSGSVAMRRMEATAVGDARSALFAKPSASDLGLLGKKSSDVHLSPAKDRKKHFGLGPLSLSNSKVTTPMGWSGARKAGILQPKESRVDSPEKGQTKLEIQRSLVRPRSQGGSTRSNGSSSPVKKRARYLLEKGIREPGRDSLPGEVGAQNHDDDDDDDDDLDIV